MNRFLFHVTPCLLSVVSPLLEFIRRELEDPFRDPRLPFESVCSERLFYSLIQEDPYTFCPGYVAR